MYVTFVTFVRLVTFVTDKSFITLVTCSKLVTIVTFVTVVMFFQVCEVFVIMMFGTTLRIIAVTINFGLSYDNSDKQTATSIANDTNKLSK